MKIYKFEKVKRLYIILNVNIYVILFINKMIIFLIDMFLMDIYISKYFICIFEHKLNHL